MIGLSSKKICSVGYVPPNRSTSLDPKELHNRNTCALLLSTFSVYRHENWSLGKPYGINPRCYWECLGEPLENLGNHKGTHWEQEGGRKKAKENPFLLQLHKCFLQQKFDKWPSWLTLQVMWYVGRLY